MASSLLNKLKLIAGESIDTTNPTDLDNPNQAIIDRYKNVPGVNLEKLTEYVNLNISEPQTIVDAIVLAEAIGYTPEQAKVVGAQWALESTRGVDTAGADYNYFGVKSHNKDVMKRMSEQYGIDVSQGDVVKTVEYINGERKVIEDTFASFNNPIEGFLGKKAFLETNKRYKKALNPENTADEFAQGLKDAGYATDPVYASKLAKIYNGPMRTTRPSWMEPTRKNNVPQADWTMTEVQPTEGSRADLVAEKANQAIEQPNVDEVLADIKYKPQVPRMPFGTSEEDVQNYLAQKQAYEQRVVDNKLNIEELSAQELAAYEANPRNFDTFENITQNNIPSAEPTTASGDFENTMTDEEYDALGIEKPFSEPQIFKQNVDLPEVSVGRTKKEGVIPLVESEVDENKYDNLEFLNTLHQPRSIISEGSFTNESRSKEQLKRDAAAEKFIMDPLQKSAKPGYFGSGQSMFYPSTRQQKYGGAIAPIIPTYYKSKGTPIYRDTTALPFRAGGHTATKYYNTGGPLDGEPVEPVNNNNSLGGAKGLVGALLNMGKLQHARAASKIEVPEKQKGMTNYDYFNSLTVPQKASIPYKEEMLNRDVRAEDAHASGVRKRAAEIGSEIGTNYGAENNIESQYDYLGVPFMYNQDSWFHNIPNNIYYDPHTCQGIACAIGRKAGAVNAKSYKTASAKGKEGAPWAIETGGRTVDHADVLAGKGLYPVDDIQAGDIVRHGYKQGSTGHNTTATGSAIPVFDLEGNTVGLEYPAAYGSHWADGVMKSDNYYMDSNTDQAFRYLRNLPAMQENLNKAQSLNSKYQNYLDSKAIAELPVRQAELIRTSPTKMPFIEKKQYPNTRRGRKQEQQNNAYIAAYMARMQKK